MPADHPSLGGLTDDLAFTYCPKKKHTHKALGGTATMAIGGYTQVCGVFSRCFVFRDDVRRALEGSLNAFAFA